jgi:hypothetical protein
MNPCIKEKELEKLTVIIDRLSKEVLGNHQEGLAKTVPRLEGKINDLVGSVASHTKVISDFITFQATHDGEVRGKKEQEGRERIAKELELTKERDRLQRRFWYVMAIIGVLGIILTVYLNFKTSKKVDTIEPTIKKEIRMQEDVSKVTRGGYVKYNDLGLSDSIKIK